MNAIDHFLYFYLIPILMVIVITLPFILNGIFINLKKLKYIKTDYKSRYNKLL